jgi:hypothetical protein
MYVEPLAFWRTIAKSLPFDPTTQTIDAFNQDIQKAVEFYEHRQPDEALKLAQLKLETNRAWVASHVA